MLLFAFLPIILCTKFEFDKIRSKGFLAYTKHSSHSLMVGQHALSFDSNDNLSINPWGDLVLIRQSDGAIFGQQQVSVHVSGGETFSLINAADVDVVRNIGLGGLGYDQLSSSLTHLVTFSVYDHSLAFRSNVGAAFFVPLFTILVTIFMYAVVAPFIKR